MKFIKMLASLLALSTLCVSDLYAAIIHVPADFPTISSAISSATPGDTIIVASGVYNEHVAINVANLILLGAQANVDARTRTYVPANESIITFAAPSFGTGIVNIASPNIVFNGFTVQGNGTIVNSTAAIFAGDAGEFLPSTATIDVTGLQLLNNIVQNNANGILIASVEPAPKATNYLVQYNYLQNNSGDPTIGNGQGVFINNSAGSVMTNVTVTDNLFNGMETGASVNLSNVTTATVSNNVMNQDNSVVLFGTTGVSITGNITSGATGVTSNTPNNTADAIFVGFDTSNTTITGNLISNATDNGININHGNSNVTITGNCIVGNTLAGISLTGGGVTNSSITINNNNIRMNTTGLSLNSGSYTSPPLLDATSNYWNSASGPNYNGTGPGTGDSITDNNIAATQAVAYTPFLTNAIVCPFAATHFSVSAPGASTAGAPLNFTVTALDQSNNVATGYAGTVHFTSSDGNAALPADSTLTNGTGSFSATLKTAGSQTITATDTVTSSITATSGPIAVSPGNAVDFIVSAPASATVGAPISFTVTALDGSANTATGYTGTVHFTSTDATGTLPGDYTFVAGDAGAHIFSATLKTAGNQTISATDTTTTSITGISGTIVVSPASSSTTLTSSSNPSVYGQSVSFAAAVAATAPGTGTPSGSVTFLDGGSPVGTGTLSSGTTTITVSTLSAGNHIITASYSGDSNFVGSMGVLNSNPQVVSKAAQTITFGPAPTVKVNGTGTATASTTATPGASYPITFSSTSTDCSVTSAGVVTGINAGNNNCVVVASQAGDSNYNAASTTQSLSIGQDAATLTLSATPNPAASNTPVTITATVIGDPPTGTVTFCDGATTTNASCTGGTTLCTTALIVGVTSSTAICSATFASAGNHFIGAFYAGDNDYAATATAVVLIEAVDPAVVPAPALNRWMLLMMGALLTTLTLNRKQFTK